MLFFSAVAAVGCGVALRYIAEAPGLELASYPHYISAKHVEELELKTWRAYIADCAWAGATDARFIETNQPKRPQKYKTQATLPRWHEVLHPELKKTEDASPIRTTDDFI